MWKSRPPSEKRQRPLDLALGRESATIICTWQKLKGRPLSGKFNSGKKKGLRCVLIGGYLYEKTGGDLTIIGSHLM